MVLSGANELLGDFEWVLVTRPQDHKAPCGSGLEVRVLYLRVWKSSLPRWLGDDEQSHRMEMARHFLIILLGELFLVHANSPLLITPAEAAASGYGLWQP